MISKIVLTISIFFSTMGLGGVAKNIDNNAVKKSSESTNNVQAAYNFQLPDIIIPPRVRENPDKANIYAQNYLLADIENNVYFADSHPDAQVPIASTTKIMTAVVTLENYELDDIVTVSKNAAEAVGATTNLNIGEKITVLELLHCMLIKSVNGAADALAEHMNTSDETGMAKFVNRMNEKAKSLGMTNTDYHDPAGLDTTGYSSARDLFTITKYALQNPTFAQIVDMKAYVAHDVTGKISHDLVNSNRLVNEWDYAGAIGVKTGYMPESGHCLVGAAKRNGHTLVAVILHTNADTPSASADEARKLLDWGFSNIVWNDKINS